MKSRILLPTLFTLFATSQFLIAQEKTPKAEPTKETIYLPKIIRVQVEFIEMPHTTLTKLMKAPRTSANDTDLREACAKLVEKEEALVIETAMINCRPGQNTTSESISELIYAKEYEPSQIPNTQNIEVEESGKGKSDIPRLISPPTPTSFDTKKVGTTLEVEAQLDGNDNLIDLRLAPTIVYSTGFETWNKWHMKETSGEMKMPSFYVLRLTTGTTLVDGQTQMIASLSPKDEKGNTDHSRKIMVFTRADILTVSK